MAAAAIGEKKLPVPDFHVSNKNVGLKLHDPMAIGSHCQRMKPGRGPRENERKTRTGKSRDAETAFAIA